MSNRFSSADAAWLHMDRPTNLMVINTVLLFDEPVDWERLKQITQKRLVDEYPKFRQRVVESRLPLRAPSRQGGGAAETTATAGRAGARGEDVRRVRVFAKCDQRFLLVEQRR